MVIAVTTHRIPAIWEERKSEILILDIRTYKEWANYRYLIPVTKPTKVTPLMSHNNLSYVGVTGV